MCLLFVIVSNCHQKEREDTEKWPQADQVAVYMVLVLTNLVETGEGFRER